MPARKEIKAQGLEQHRDIRKSDYQFGIVGQYNGMTSTKVKRCNSALQLSKPRDLGI